MWLWILSALFLALVWAVWFLLRPGEGGPAGVGSPPWTPAPRPPAGAPPRGGRSG